MASDVVDVPPQIPANLGKLVLGPLNFALAAGEREALKIGVPSHEVIEMLLNHLASVVAMIEPAGVRASTMTDVVKHFPELVRQHVDARLTTPGGIRLPRGI